MSPWNSNDDDQGVVIRKDIGIYKVSARDGIISCDVSSRIHKQLLYSSGTQKAVSRRVDRVTGPEETARVVVGDGVRFRDDGNGSGSIIAVMPRRNSLVRRDPAHGSHPFKQVIASNLDLMIPVFAVASPAPKWGLLDRYLVSAESMEIPSLILITKNDLFESLRTEES